MNTLKWVSWFVIGLLAAIIYYRKIKTQKEREGRDISTEGVLFVLGWISMIYLLLILVIKKISKQ